jgi:hypothetical protein
MENSMGSMYFRKVRKRAETVIGLMNLTYNMFRKVQLQQANVPLGQGQLTGNL